MPCTFAFFKCDMSFNFLGRSKLDEREGRPKFDDNDKWQE